MLFRNTFLRYLVQPPHYLVGTLYYCADKTGSLCMIKSFEVTLTPDGKETKVTLPVN